MEVTRDVDGGAFQAAITPVWDAFVAAHGDTLIKAIQAASAE